ncbi:4a-hydroxytetrahydrobiopterin dehydratase [Aliifodinibius sp. S!AR15-10]|uniref:4a-hydroxytetrahydrobiopterin dehydratase n=1 Tax=Aliifodinibius sp. S!AR15-10 TaxID=2950437 RepID=UPI00285A7842|nr:4a-hydroxytetrahydrobiopterin dehydratase [Aliifodinibius sp. S!AR15-10]MDR8390568.1 4a-hydroxytetrahydrobiopterin dehydratase [Aliifodinibius sp. S!AR15-10]
MATPLSEDKIAKALSDLDGWSHEDDKLKKDFSFDNFRDAIAFINRIAFEAEEQVHHPELFNVYNSVSIALSTHDAGGKVTEKDLKLAKTIESLYNA